MKITKTAQAIIMAVLTTTTVNTVYAETAVADPKAIHLRERPTATANSEVTISVKASKKQYKVGESMSFNVKGNDNYYLYVFNIDENSGDSVLLIPNAKTKNNYLKKGKTYKMPGTVDFFSDAAGYEKVVFVATREKIDLDRINTKSMGDLSTTKTKALEGAFEAKAIRIRDNANTGNASGETSLADNVKVLSVKIVGGAN